MPFSDDDDMRYEGFKSAGFTVDLRSTFTVGDSLGWDFSVGSWTNGKQFKAEDMLKIPPEKTITLSSYCSEIEDVTFKVGYTVQSIGREFCFVFFGDTNVALMVVSDGWVKVREQGQ
ncbi:Ribonuclease TUDOR 1 [Camellia lanceoleosa]|uniref:Ribonuclease TUDOR 1 n=1 Tax=Camellia lanceoleosa TaxID=1840588 RepID=A0ACC0GRB6_9ERIC|nr:Ribonuclease TUDOR 1 [Camellia lanceoleosa]